MATGPLLGRYRGGTEKLACITYEWLLRFPDQTGCGPIET